MMLAITNFSMNPLVVRLIAHDASGKFISSGDFKLKGKEQIALEFEQEVFGGDFYSPNSNGGYLRGSFEIQSNSPGIFPSGYWMGNTYLYTKSGGSGIKHNNMVKMDWYRLD